MFLWLIITSLVFFLLSKPPFSVFLEFEVNFVRAQKNSKYHDLSPLTWWKRRNRLVCECHSLIILRHKAPAKRSQHANATLLGATCCVCLATLLRHVGCCWLKLTIFKLEPTTPCMSQHITTRWPNARNMLRYVALACCDRLAGAKEYTIYYKECSFRKESKIVQTLKMFIVCVSLISSC